MRDNLRRRIRGKELSRKYVRYKIKNSNQKSAQKCCADFNYFKFSAEIVRVNT